MPTKGFQPIPNKLIKLWCHDWSPYTCVGMIVPYKKPPPGKKVCGSRFMMRDAGGNFTSARDAWSDMERWEYLESEIL